MCVSVFEVTVAQIRRRNSVAEWHPQKIEIELKVTWTDIRFGELGAVVDSVKDKAAPVKESELG